MDSAGLDTARKLLRQRLLAMVGVQSCQLPLAEPRLIVQMWTGVVIHIHLIVSQAKTRSIKRVLQENTDVGIGTMFIVERSLLPDANLRLAVPEWLMALHALTYERIYAFALNAGDLVLSQLHFEPIGTSGDMGAKYGPAPKLDRLRFLRTAIKPRYIRGDWQLADFGPEAFWKDPYGPRHGTHTANTYHRPDPREYQWKSWSSTSWEQSQAQDVPRPPVVTPHERLAAAYAVLRLEQDATKDDARAAYRKLALDYHPDTSTLPKAEAEQKFRELNDAYEAIRTANKWT